MTNEERAEEVIEIAYGLIQEEDEIITITKQGLIYQIAETLTQVRNEAIEEAVKVVVEKDEFLGQNKDIAQAIEALKDGGAIQSRNEGREKG